MSSSDRALVNAFKEIRDTADRINGPRTIVDRADFFPQLKFLRVFSWLLLDPKIYLFFSSHFLHT